MPKTSGGGLRVFGREGRTWRLELSRWSRKQRGWFCKGLEGRTGDGAVAGEERRAAVSAGGPLAGWQVGHLGVMPGAQPPGQQPGLQHANTCCCLCLHCRSDGLLLCGRV